MVSQRKKKLTVFALAKIPMTITFDKNNIVLSNYGLLFVCWPLCQIIMIVQTSVFNLFLYLFLNNICTASVFIK